MKAIMTAVVMMGLFSVAGASVKNSTSAPSKIQIKSDSSCHMRTAKKLEKAKSDYAHLLNEAPTKKAPVQKSAPAKGVDSKRS